MKILTRGVGRFTIGIWIALVAILLTLLAWIMQSYSLLNWEGAINLGIQNESFSGPPVEQALANVERGIALPSLLGILGLWTNRKLFIQ